MKLWDILWEIFGNIFIYEYINQKMKDKLGKIMGYICKKYRIFSENYRIYYGIYWLKIVGYIWQNYGIYWSIG